MINNDDEHCHQSQYHQYKMQFEIGNSLKNGGGLFVEEKENLEMVKALD